MENYGLSFSGHKIYVGIDVHKTNWKVNIFSENTHCTSFSQDPNPEQLVRYLQKNYPDADYKTAYEAGFSGFWLHHALLKAGIDSIVVHPGDIPTTDKEKKQKEDKRDSRKIALTLRSGQLTPIYTPTPDMLEDRSLVRLRLQLVGERTRWKNRIKSFLHFHGKEVPAEYTDCWSKAFIQWLQELDFHQDSGKSSLHTLIKGYQESEGQIRQTTRMIRALSKQGKYANNVKLLRSVPGVGLLSAMLFLTEIIDINRFKKLDYLCSYVGLVPTSNSSGNNTRHGNMTKRANANLKAYLVEAAWVSVRKDPALNLAFNEYCKTMNKKNAIIRIAKRLLNRIRYVLKQQIPYEKGVAK